MECVFCNTQETSDTKVCGDCVQKLLLVDIEIVKAIYPKATPFKKEALDDFFGAETFKEEINELPTVSRSLNRSRSN